MRRQRLELDKFLPDTQRKVLANICEGGCEEHIGEAQLVRVFSKSDGADWGYFSYCKSAQDEDVNNRGMELEFIK